MFSFCFYIAAQTPFQPQLAIPVFFNSVAQPVANAEKHRPDTYLSGIALMFLDTADTNDELLLTGSSDLVIWHDNIGKSTKITYIVPDSQFIGRLELLYFDAKCVADLWWQDRVTGQVQHATGDLLSEPSGYALYLTTDGKTDKALANLFFPLNVELMELHTRQMRRVPVKSWYNRDSINVIVGADSQFNTNYELFWLDQSLRSRLRTVASNSYSKMFLFSNPVSSLADSVMNGQRQVIHRVSRTENGVNGRISIVMKPDGSARYVFLKPTHRYRLYIDYSFSHQQAGPGALCIKQVGLRDLETGDFVDMNILDFLDNGLPVLYVDLINGVVTAAEDKWDIANVIHAVEDVISVSVMPEE